MESVFSYFAGYYQEMPGWKGPVCACPRARSCTRWPPGQPPFSRKHDGVISNAILSQAPPPLLRLNPETPPKLEEIINRLPEKDRGLRPRNAPDLRSELKRLKRDSA
jgi:hypothetical protein